MTNSPEQESPRKTTVQLGPELDDAITALIGESRRKLSQTKIIRLALQEFLAAHRWKSGRLVRADSQGSPRKNDARGDIYRDGESTLVQNDARTGEGREKISGRLAAPGPGDPEYDQALQWLSEIFTSGDGSVRNAIRNNLEQFARLVEFTQEKRSGNPDAEDEPDGGEDSEDEFAQRANEAFGQEDKDAGDSTGGRQAHPKDRRANRGPERKAGSGGMKR